MTSTVCAFAVSSLFIFGLSAFPCFTHVSMLCKEKWKLYIEWSHFTVFNSKLFLIAFYVVTPEPVIWLELLAIAIRVLLLIMNIIFIFVQLFFRDYSRSYMLVTWTSYVFCIYFDRAHSKEKQTITGTTGWGYTAWHPKLMDVWICGVWLAFHITSW